MYLWCSKCFRATVRDRWRFDIAKHGVCPVCLATGFRNARDWASIAALNGYPAAPDASVPYDAEPALF